MQHATVNLAGVYDRLVEDGLETTAITYSCLIRFAAEAGSLKDGDKEDNDNDTEGTQKPMKYNMYGDKTHAIRWRPSR